MSTLSLISQFPVSKADRELFKRRMKSEILLGERSALDYAVYLAAIEKVFKELRTDEELENAILNEHEKRNEKSFDYKGATLTRSETGVSYDFESDSKWVTLDRLKKQIDTEIKEREKILKAITNVLIEVDADTGQIIEIYPPLKKSKTKVVVTLKS
jgi:hypothetical protein